MNRRGITLVETLAVVVLMAALAPVLGHMLASASGSIATTASDRSAMDESGYALRAATRSLSNALAVPGTTITTAGRDEIELSTGLRLRVSGGDLLMTKAGLPEAPLARDVSDFELVYHDADAQPLTGPFDAETLEGIARIGIVIGAHDLSFAGRVYRETARTYPAPPSGLWIETFDELATGQTWDDGETAWETDLNGLTYASHGVNTDRYAFSLTRPRGLELEWRSEVINISGIEEPVLAFSTWGSGTLDSRGSIRDWLHVFIESGGTEQRVFAASGWDGAHQEFVSPVLSGDEVRIIARTQVTGGDEFYTIDNVRIVPKATAASVVDERTIYEIDLFAAESIDIRNASVGGVTVSGRDTRIRSATVGNNNPSGTGGVAVDASDYIRFDRANVFSGDVRAGRVSQNRSSTVHDGEIITGFSSAPIALYKNQLQRLVDDADEADATTVAQENGTLSLATDQTISFFRVTQTNLHAARNIVITAPPSATVYIVCDGSSPRMREFSISSGEGTPAPSNIAWIFPDAQRLRLNRGHLLGTVFAPRASVYSRDTTHTGSIFARRIEIDRAAAHPARFTGSKP